MRSSRRVGHPIGLMPMLMSSVQLLAKLGCPSVALSWRLTASEERQANSSGRAHYNGKSRLISSRLWLLPVSFEQAILAPFLLTLLAFVSGQQRNE